MESITLHPPIWKVSPLCLILSTENPQLKFIKRNRSPFCRNTLKNYDYQKYENLLDVTLPEMKDNHQDKQICSKQIIFVNYFLCP